MRTIFLLFFLVLLLAPNTTILAQKRVVVEIEAIFPFEPMYGRYVRKSLPSVATYMEAWRVQEPTITLEIRDSLSWAYRYYILNVDTTLMPRVLSYLDASTCVDTTLESDDLSDFPQSRSFLEHFDSDVEKIKRFFATPIRLFDSILQYNPYGDSGFEALFHSFQCAVTDAEFSLFSPSKLDLSIPKELYIKHIASILWYDNDLVVVELTGVELRELMESSYARRYYRVRDERSDLLRFRTPAYLHTSLSSVVHTVNLTKKRGSMIENWPLKAEQKYRIAMNSFLARNYKVVARYGDYKMLLINWLKGDNATFNQRVKTSIQPARVVDKIVCRESKTIFGK